MKKILLILALVAGMVGCATSKPIYHSQITDDVYLDPGYVWSNSPQYHGKGKHGVLRAVTMRLLNRKYIPVKVTVECTFGNGPEFGSTQVVVEPRGDKTFVVRGLGTAYTTVGCGITNIE